MMGDGAGFKALTADQRAATLAQVDLLSKHLLGEYARAQQEIHTRLKLRAGSSRIMLWLTAALVAGISGAALAVLAPVLAVPGSLQSFWSSGVFLAMLIAAIGVVFVYVMLMRQLVRSAIAHSFHIRSASAYARDHIAGGLKQLSNVCAQLGGTAPEIPVHAWDAHLGADQRKSDFNGESAAERAGIAAMTCGFLALAGLLVAHAWMGQVLRAPAWQSGWGVTEATARYGFSALGAVLAVIALSVTISAGRLAGRLEAFHMNRPASRAPGPIASPAEAPLVDSPQDDGPLSILNRPLVRPGPAEESDSFSSLLFERRK